MGDKAPQSPATDNGSAVEKAATDDLEDRAADRFVAPGQCTLRGCSLPSLQTGLRAAEGGAARTQMPAPLLPGVGAHDPRGRLDKTPGALSASFRPLPLTSA